MKEQQHSLQPIQTQKKTEKEQRTSWQKHTPQLPAQQWARLLQNLDSGLLDLPAPLLEQLAESVGNSSLAELLRQGGGNDPALFAPETLAWNELQPEENPIETAPPALFPLTDWPAVGEAWLPPMRPSDLGKGGGYG